MKKNIKVLNITNKIWLIAFIYCILVSLAIQLVILPRIPEIHGGNGLLKHDATLFHNQAIKQAAKIKMIGWSQWRLISSEIPGNVGILSLLYTLFGTHPWLFIPINAVLHATSAAFIFIIGTNLNNGYKGRMAGIIASFLYIIFPSSALWCSQNHKDEFAICGTFCILYSWLLLIGEKKLKVSVLKIAALTSIGATLIILVRSYLLIMTLTALLVCLLVHVVVYKSRAIKTRIKCLASFFGIIALYIFISFLFPSGPSSDLAFNRTLTQNPTQNPTQNWRWEHTSYIPKEIESPIKRLSELRQHFITNGELDSAKSNFDDNIRPKNIKEFLLSIPCVSISSIFRPLPNTWFKNNNLFWNCASFEMIIWYLSFTGIIILLIVKADEKIISGLIFSLIILFIYCYTNPNLGTLYRVRYGPWMYILLNGIIGLLLFKDLIKSRLSRRESINSI
jgi:predicted membrane protein